MSKSVPTAPLISPMIPKEVPFPMSTEYTTPPPVYEEKMQPE